MKWNRREFLGATAAGVTAVHASGRSASALDPLNVRDDFPATESGAYLDTPYIGPPPKSVEEEGIRFTRAKSKRPISLGSMLAKRDETRAKYASLFGASEEEIAFLYATTEGENIVTNALDWKPGDNVVLDDLHYTTSYVLYKTLEKEKGVELRIVPSHGGRADVSDFEPQVNRRTRLVSVAWVSHQNGFRHDLKGLAALAHANGALLYTDGVQAMGMIETNLHDEGVDFVGSGTYKWLFGSYGIAPFYIRAEHLDRIAPDRVGFLSVEKEGPNHAFEFFSNAKKFEYATLSFGPMYQLAASLDYIERVGLSRIESHTVPLAQRLRESLIDRGFDVRTPADNGSAIVAFVHGKDPESLKERFGMEDIRVSFREGDSQIRAGIAMFNTQDDVDRFLTALAEVG